MPIWSFNRCGCGSRRSERRSTDRGFTLSDTAMGRHFRHVNRLPVRLGPLQDGQQAVVEDLARFRRRKVPPVLTLEEPYPQRFLGVFYQPADAGRRYIQKSLAPEAAELISRFDVPVEKPLTISEQEFETAIRKPGVTFSEARKP